MIKNRISGITDEITSDFEQQLQAAVRMGLQYISLRNIDGVNIGECSEELFETRVLRLCEAYQIKVSSISSPLGKIQLGDTSAYEKQLAAAKRICSYAHRLNCAYVRVFSFYLPDGASAASYRQDVLDGLHGFLDCFSGSGITLLHENEKGIYGDTPERCLELAQALNDTRFGLIFDPANFVQVEIDPLQAFDMLQPYIRYIHIKDADKHSGLNVVCGTGDGKIPELLKRLEQLQYDGFFTLEPHLVTFEGLAQLEQHETRAVIDTTRQMAPYDAFALQLQELQKCMES